MDNPTTKHKGEAFPDSFFYGTGKPHSFFFGFCPPLLMFGEHQIFSLADPPPAAA
jgi:hypothetical protein